MKYNSVESSLAESETETDTAVGVYGKPRDGDLFTRRLLREGVHDAS